MHTFRFSDGTVVWEPAETIRVGKVTTLLPGEVGGSGGMSNGMTNICGRGPSVRPTLRRLAPRAVVADWPEGSVVPSVRNEKYAIEDVRFLQKAVHGFLESLQEF